MKQVSVLIVHAATAVQELTLEGVGRPSRTHFVDERRHLVEAFERLTPQTAREQVADRFRARAYGVESAAADLRRDPRRRESSGLPLVRRYLTDSATLVAVQDGKVAVQATVLAANQQVTIGRGNVVRVGRADPSRFTFAAGVLTLEGVPLRDAIPDLNRWYGVDIRIADSTLASNRIQATFTAGSISNLSAILEMAFGVRVVRNGRVLTLYRE